MSESVRPCFQCFRKGVKLFECLMQVYASINPVVHLVNVGSESGGVRSLANVTVIFLSPCHCFRCFYHRYPYFETIAPYFRASLSVQFLL